MLAGTPTKRNLIPDRQPSMTGTSYSPVLSEHSLGSAIVSTQHVLIVREHARNVGNSVYYLRSSLSAYLRKLSGHIWEWRIAWAQGTSTCIATTESLQIPRAHCAIINVGKSCMPYIRKLSKAWPHSHLTEKK